MSSTPAASYTTIEPTRRIVYAEPRPFAPYVYEDEVEHFVYGKWEYDLLEAPRDCMVRTLPCVSVAQISARVQAGSYTSMLWKQLAFHIGVVVYIIAAFILAFYYIWVWEEAHFAPILIAGGVTIVIGIAVSLIWAKQLAALRKSVRDRFQIEGSTSDDMWAVYCCLSCAIAQMMHQTKSSDLNSCDVQPRDALPPYQP
jgi:Cys-rich protein (TIGR01571 family)